MKKNIAITLIAIGCELLVQSCAPSRLTKMSAVVSSDQKVGFEDTIISQKKHFVSLAPYEELDVAKDKTMFMLGIQSGGDTPFDFGYDNILVYFQDSGMTQPQNRINIQTYEEFSSDLREEQRRNENKYIRDGLEDIIYKLESYSSSSSSSSSSSQSSSMSSGSSSSSSSSMDTTEEDVEIMLDDLELDIESMRTNNQLLRDALPDIIMSPRTIIPGDVFSSVVVCDTSKLEEKMEGRFQVAVLVDGEKHLFTFNRLLNK